MKAKIPFPKTAPQIILNGFGLQNVKALYYKGVLPTEEPDNYKPLRPSYLGTPVFANLIFIPGKYKDKKGVEVVYGEILKNDDLGENFEINTVLIDVSQQKQIIKTNIQGLAGTVKEYISMGDYQVSIRGALVSESSETYPETEVRQLREYLEAETAVGVASRFLSDIFDVETIVIEGFSFPQSEGVPNVQLFEISAVSDKPIELTVLNKGARIPGART